MKYKDLFKEANDNVAERYALMIERIGECAKGKETDGLLGLLCCLMSGSALWHLTAMIMRQ